LIDAVPQAASLETKPILYNSPPGHPHKYENFKVKGKGKLELKFLSRTALAKILLTVDLPKASSVLTNSRNGCDYLS